MHCVCMQITYELVLPENVSWNGSKTTDGGETMIVLCLLQPLSKYSLSMSALTSTTATGPQVLGSPQVISFWTAFAERPSRPVVMSVSPWTATLSVEPLDHAVADLIFSVSYVVLHSRNSSSSVGPPVTLQQSPHFSDAWTVGLQLASERLNQSRTVQLGGTESTRLEPGVSYSVSLLVIAFMVDHNVIYSYSWPPVSLTTMTLTTWTRTTSTDGGTSERYSTPADVHSTMTSSDAKESTTSGTATHPRVTNFTSSVVSRTSLAPEQSLSSSSSTSSMTTDVGHFGSLSATAVSSRTKITSTSTSSPSSTYFLSDSSSAATATPHVKVEMTSLSQLATTVMTSSDWATISSSSSSSSSATDRDRLSTSHRLTTTNGAKLVTSLMTSESRWSSMQTLTTGTDWPTSPPLTTDVVVTTATPLMAGESCMCVYVYQVI